MNPYLEHPERWSSVHNRLIVALADVLTPQLLPKYQVDIEKRVYEVIGANSLLVGRSDVSVQKVRMPTEEMPAITTSRLAEPIKVALPMLEEVREAYLEVKDAATKDVIAIIEILSPTNKRGEGRQKYMQKRQQVFNSCTHLIEIDLLRDAEPLPMLEPAPQSDYRILVSRAETRPVADLYAFNLPDSVPLFRLPLQAGADEPIINLQELIEQVYQRSGYDYFIDYQLDPLPPLSAFNRAWLDSQLRQQGLR